MADEAQPTTEKRKPPAAGRGRKKGEVNKTTAALKEAILLAAEEVGENGKGKGGLVGYLRFVATKEPKAFAGLLGRVLPLQLTGAGGGPIEHALTVSAATGRLLEELSGIGADRLPAPPVSH